MAIILLTGFNQLNASTISLQAQKPEIKAEDLKPAEDFVYKEANPLNLVAQPQKYLNKRMVGWVKPDKKRKIYVTKHNKRSKSRS